MSNEKPFQEPEQILSEMIFILSRTAFTPSITFCPSTKIGVLDLEGLK